MKVHRSLQTWCVPMLLFQFLISCQAPGLNERTIHPPHRIYSEQLAQLSSTGRSIQAKARPVEELGKSGLPEQCRAYTVGADFCLECHDEPIPIKRCRSGFVKNFNPQRGCRFTPHLLRCLDHASQVSLLVHLQNNQESKFLVQFDMMLETLDLIVRNKVNNQRAKKQASKLIKLIGSSKSGLFQDNRDHHQGKNTELMQLLSQYKDKEKKELLEKMQRGYEELQSLRLSGELTPQNALQFMLAIFETGGVDPEILRIVQDVDTQGLNSL